MKPLTLHPPTNQPQSGFVLLEALIAILIFSFGILAIMGLQAAAINDVRDTKYRSDAAFLADQIIAHMWTSTPNDPITGISNLNQYAFNTGGANCTFNGGFANARPAAVTNNVNNWGTDIQGQLPGSTVAQRQIIVGANNMVTVTICWRAPQDAAGTFHNHTVTAQIQGFNAP